MHGDYPEAVRSLLKHLYNFTYDEILQNGFWRGSLSAYLISKKYGCGTLQDEALQDLKKQSLLFTDSRDTWQFIDDVDSEGHFELSELAETGQDKYLGLLLKDYRFRQQLGTNEKLLERCSTLLQERVGQEEIQITSCGRGWNEAGAKDDEKVCSACMSYARNTAKETVISCWVKKTDSGELLGEKVTE